MLWTAGSTETFTEPPCLLSDLKGADLSVPLGRVPASELLNNHNSCKDWKPPDVTHSGGMAPTASSASAQDCIPAWEGTWQDQHLSDCFQTGPETAAGPYPGPIQLAALPAHTPSDACAAEAAAGAAQPGAHAQRVVVQDESVQLGCQMHPFSGQAACRFRIRSDNAALQGVREEMR